MNRMLVIAAVFAVAWPVQAQVAIGPKLPPVGDENPVPLPKPIIVPAPIGDLEATGATDVSVTLTWTPPNDPNALLGNVAFYDIRYSAEAPSGYLSDEEWFSIATPLEDNPLPSLPDALQEFTIGGLQPGVSYYFAIKSSMDGTYWSGISRIAFATTTVVAPGGEGIPPKPVVEVADVNKGGNAQGCGNSAGGRLGLAAAAALVAGLALAGRR